MVVYLLTTGDGTDGNEWTVISIHASAVSAAKAQIRYAGPIKRPDGSEYIRDANIEEWPVEE